VDTIYDTVLSATKAAEAMGLDTPTLRTASTRIAPVTARKEVEKNLEVSIARADSGDIQKQLKAAQALDISSSSGRALQMLQERVNAAEKMLTHIEKEKQALVAMQNCTKTGGWFKDGDSMPKWDHIQQVLVASLASLSARCDLTFFLV
jgi:hypothetical protein